MSEAVWTCGCGSVEAEVPTTGMRIICYCETCRAFVERLGHGERLDYAGGNDLLQVAPHQVRFRKGQDKLGWFQVTPKGPLRWYATCCGTPMVNTLGTMKFPFASFQVADLKPQEGLPKVRARVNLKGATTRVTEPVGSALALVFGLLSRVAKARLTGNWKTNPFFGEDGRPIVARTEPQPPTG